MMLDAEAPTAEPSQIIADLRRECDEALAREAATGRCCRSSIPRPATSPPPVTPSPSRGRAGVGGDVEDASVVKKEPSTGVRNRARTLRRQMTEAERRLWQILRLRQTDGRRFRRQVPIGPFIADFVCHEARLIVEIDGGQHDPSSEAEASRTRFLEGEGYRVLRFWNNEVLEKAEGVRSAIAKSLHPVTPNVTPTPSLPLEGEGGK